MGKPIEDHSKQELINIIVSQANEIALIRKQQRGDLKIFGYPVVSKDLDLGEEAANIKFGKFEDIGKLNF